MDIENGWMTRGPGRSVTLGKRDRVCTGRSIRRVTCEGAESLRAKG